MSRKARMHLIIFFLTITLSMPALAQPSSQSASSANFHRSTTTLVSPATPTTGTYFDHVVTIMMENEGVFDICNDSPPPCNANKTIDPFLGGLANNYTIAAQYLSLIPTSQPNYVALISGSMQGCTASGCPTPNKAANLVDRLESAGLTWKGYFENMTVTPGSCNGALNSPEPYNNIHNPFIVFQDITNSTSRCNKLVDANPSSCGSMIDCALVNDLNNATAAGPSFMWLTPNDCNDMRGNQICNNNLLIQPGDAYLSKLVPLILTSRTFTTSRSALFITFDEGNGFCPGPYQTSESCVYTVWAGSATKTHFGSGNLYNHYSFTKTIEANWNFTGFTINDANANPMTEFFKNQLADFQISTSQYTTTTPVGVRSNSTLNLASFNNFTGTVTITATSTPPGPSVTLTPAIVTLTQQGTATSTLSFSTTTTGTYSLAVRATSGSLGHNKTMTITVAPPDFAISADPSSLTIGLTTSTVTSPVTVNATGDNSFFEYSYLESSFNAKGSTWLFYEDSRSTCEHQTGCLMYTTTTNGTKWAAPTRVPVHITDGDFSVYTNGTSVFYARYNETSYDSTCGRNLQFRVGTLNTNRTITWQPERLVAAGAINRAYSDDEIIVDSNGQAWIAYMIDNKSSCGGTGTQRPQIIHSAGTNYGSWTGNVTICVAVCHSFDWHNHLASLGNGQVYSLYWNLKFGIHGRLYNGTAWGPEETISTDTPDTNSWLFNSGTSVYAIYYDNNTETYNFGTRSPTGSWTIKLIGTAETHTGISFSLAYYALPDTASYDAKDNIFELFYMNSTAQRIDQWSGQDGTWNKFTGVLATTPVPYADSISSFIQSNSTTVTGEIYYVSGTTSFTINSVNLVFTPPGNTASFTTMIAGQNGFRTAVTLTNSITPTTGLSASCNPSTIIGGTGVSSCHLTSTAPGNYTVTLTGTGSSLAHNTTVTVRVVAFPDFTITSTTPTPANAGQTIGSNITITSLNGFTGVVALMHNSPLGLSCSSIGPSTVTGSGTAMVSCNATTWGNYTLTLTGTSASLIHNSTITFQFQDFVLTATPPTQVYANIPATIVVTVASLNHFSMTVSLGFTAPPGLSCGAIMPVGIQGSGTATLPCTASGAGNYTLILTAVSGPLSHSVSPLLQVTDFSVAATPTLIMSPIGSNATSTITVAGVNGYSGNVNLNATIVSSIVFVTGLGGSGHAPLAMAPPSSEPNTILSPATLNITRNAAGQSILTISLSPNVRPGSYVLLVTATQGPLTRTLQFTVEATDFSISPSATSVSINTGTNTSLILNLASLNGYQGNVTLSTIVSPSGPTTALNPSSLLLTTHGTSILTIIVPSTTPAGNYTLTVQATSGTLSHTVSITVTVTSGLTTSLARTLASPSTTAIGLFGFAGLFALFVTRTRTPKSTRRPSSQHKIQPTRILAFENRRFESRTCTIVLGSLESISS